LSRLISTECIYLHKIETTKTWLWSNTITGDDAAELKKSEPLRLGILLNPMTFGSENSRRSSILLLTGVMEPN
jgi:hypothetical protein